MTNKRYVLLTCSLISALLHAAPLTRTHLADGRLIQLDDDYTWHYVLDEPATNPTTPHNETEVSQLGSQVLADPELLHTVAASGVKVQLIKQQRKGNQLGLMLNISNLAAGSVVQVRGRITLYSAQGLRLSQQESPFWQAEYRLPESYLRQDQTRPFRTLWLPLPPHEDAPLIRLEIVDVERRS